MNREEFVNRTDITTIGYSAHETAEILGLSEKIAPRICVESRFVKQARQRGKHTSCVIDFPFGSPDYTPLVEKAIVDGVQEIDIPLPAIIVSDPTLMRRERYPMSLLGSWWDNHKLPPHPDILYKIILHTDQISKIHGEKDVPTVLFLADWIRKQACNRWNLMMKTCTGYGPGGATPEMVSALASEGHRVKASGGIRSRDQVESLSEAGAELFGIGFGSYINIAQEFGE